MKTNVSKEKEIAQRKLFFSLPVVFELQELFNGSPFTQISI